MLKYYINLISYAKLLRKFTVLAFFSSFFIIKNWFRRKKYSCKFLQKSIVKKKEIGSNIIFLLDIHTCNFLTIDFYEYLQEYFFVQNQFLIIKNEEKYYKILNLRNILA